MNNIDFIEDFKNLHIYDPKMDSLFKIVFGNKDKDRKEISKSLIEAVLPNEVKISDLNYENLEILPQIYKDDIRKITVDIYAIDEKNKEHYVIEMQIHEKKDIMGRSELSTSRILEHIYKPKDDIVEKERIYAINFIYFDMFPNDENYYHHFYLQDKNNSKNSSHFKDIIIIELKKFKEKYNLKKLQDEISQNNNAIDREIRRKLWFTFFSSINVVYHKPSNQNDNYWEFKKIQKKDKTIKNVYIKHEINEELYKLLIKENPIKMAIDCCIKLSEEEKKEFSKDVELELLEEELSELKRQKDEEISELKRQKDEMKILN